MNITVDGNEIVDYMKQMYEYLNEYKNELITMQNLKKNVLWESTAAEKALFQYDQEINELVSFGNKMVLLVDYLNKFLNNYDNSLNEIKGNFKKLNNEFDMMKVKEK